MSWPMPTATGQWNPGMAGAPDMNMGNYTPEQWAAVQQQNWQQWAQWQQQYAQWQSQYGEKYAQQMQAMQAMGAMPPLPATGAAPPPAPPPPEQPPPPPPHENNQPLYAPAPVPAPPPATAPRTAPGYNNATFAGNNQSWYPDAPPETTQSVNADALKKLAEEERLFDIQFQKWEEEIKKWKQDNVNHPDKEAYKEYESKFEACRVQLLERRQQMKQRRARLLGHAPAAPTTGNNNLPPAPPPNQTKPNYPNAPPQSQNYNIPPSNYQNQNKQQNQQQYNNAPVSNFNRSNNKNIDPQDRYESYQNMEDYSGTTNTSEKQAFLPASGSSKGIPGLDLVPDTEKHPPPSQDVIDITEDGHPQNIQPDYSKISKGINNILGDEKIMNILSMVRSQVAPQDAPRGQNAPVHGYGGPPGGPSGPPGPLGHGGPGGYSGPVGHGGPGGPVGHGGPGGPVGHGGPGGSVGHGGPGGPVGHSGPGGQVGHGGSVGPSGHGGTGGQGGSGGHGGTGGQMGPGPGPYNSMNNQNMPPNNQWNRNDNQYNNSFNNSTANNSSQQFDNRQNMPYNRQGQPHMDQNQGPNRGYNQDMGGNQYNDRNAQYGGPNMGVGPRGPMFKPNMPPRPLLDLPVPNNINDMQRQGQGNRGMQGNNMQGNNMPDNRNMNNMGMNDGRGMQENMPPVNQAPPRPKWVEEPLFTPSIIVEYEHKALRLKARDFIEPVHTFDYDHISKDEEYKQKDFESEVDQLFTRKPRNDLGYEKREERSRSERERYNHESSHVFERRREREEPRDDFRSRVPPRDEYDERRRDRPDPYFDRRRDDRDKYTRREEPYRDREKERYRDIRREEPRSRDRSRSRERDRKRGRSKDSELSDYSKKSRENDNVARQIVEPKHFIMIDDILEPPGRDMRPEKIVIILRGPPGSGKSYLAKLIRDREAEYGGAVRIMSIDDYFMQEGDIEERDPTTGKIVKKQTLKYEYDEKLEETYLNSLKRAFKRSLTDGYFSFLIYDAVNDQLKNYADIWNFSRQNGFQVYICTMELDPQVCHKRNIHNRTLDDIQTITTRFFKTPAHHIQLDPTTLLQSAAIEDVQMEDATDDVIVEDDVTEVETSFTSKWEKMDNADKLARLDGTSKPLRPSQLSMEDYLQLDDWKPTQAKPGKKTVRWADIEERRQQEKMRAIGFVVGQTDWNRMTDPTMGSSALTQTKYIERVRRN